VKRTTGIPKAFLKTVEKPVAFNSDGLTDDSKQASGVMMTAEGEYVIAEPDKASWDLFQAKAKAAQEQQKAAASGSQELRDRGLECPIDKRMFVDPVKTPCCGKTYCNDCIENALVNSDLVCPNCSTEGVLIDDLVPDEETIKRIREFEEEKAKERKEKEASKSPKSEPAKPAQVLDAEPSNVKEKSASPTPNETSNSAANSPSAAGANSSADDANSKKRPAEEDLESNRVPTAPAAMRKQQEAEKAAQDAADKVLDPTQNFIQQMNALGNLQPTTQSVPMPFNGPGMVNPMGMMNPNMGMPMMPMGGMGMQMGMGPGMGPGMGMPMSMPGMMGMQNPMMNPMTNNGWNNFNNMNNMGGGFPQQPGMYNNGPNYMNGGGPSMMNGYGQGHNQNPQSWPGQQPPGGNEEDNAYFRKPVNPHRHHNRARRAARPTDYTEL
jgi:protein MPE1